MKYKLPIGKAIIRRAGENQWDIIETIKEVVYTQEELGELKIDSLSMPHYIISIPLTDGYNSIKVYEKDLYEI